MPKPPPRKKPRQKNPRIPTALKLIRIQRGIEQKVVAETLGIFPAELSKIENGIQIPSPKTKTLLAGFFSVSEQELFPPNKRA